MQLVLQLCKARSAKKIFPIEISKIERSYTLRHFILCDNLHRTEVNFYKSEINTASNIFLLKMNFLDSKTKLQERQSLFMTSGIKQFVIIW